MNPTLHADMRRAVGMRYRRVGVGRALRIWQRIKTVFWKPARYSGGGEDMTVRIVRIHDPRRKQPKFSAATDSEGVTLTLQGIAQQLRAMNDKLDLILKTQHPLAFWEVDDEHI